MTKRINPVSENVLRSIRQKIEKVKYIKSSDGKKLIKVVQVNPVSLAKYWLIFILLFIDYLHVPSKQSIDIYVSLVDKR
jgi:hypothetical protein